VSCAFGVIVAVVAVFVVAMRHGEWVVRVRDGLEPVVVGVVT
jgi:hypothetical protein